jgi:hypothetical protein
MSGEAGAAIARFAFTSGPKRGSHLTLYANCVIHRSEHELETIPLAAVASVRVAFERDPNRLAWGVVAVLVAFVLFAISSPLATVSDAAAADVAGNPSGVAAALHGLFRIIGAAARALPFVALACGLGGAALAVLGWLGVTVLSLAFPGGERAYLVRGRNTPLIDFAEAISQKLMLLKR